MSNTVLIHSNNQISDYQLYNTFEHSIFNLSKPSETLEINTIFIASNLQF